MGERIAIIGNAGGGKSRLAKSLAHSRNLPLHQLDLLQWNPGWVPAAEADFVRRHRSLIAGTQWVIDGMASWESVCERLNRADTIVYVDLPLWRHYWWAAKRQALCVFRPRPDFVPGCPMLPMTGRLIRMMWSLHFEVRPKLLEIVSELRRSKHVYELRSMADVNRFYAKYCA